MAGEPPTTDGPSGLAFGPYSVMRRPDGSPWRLGAGGMGVTYKAMDDTLDRPVAVKTIAPGRWHEPRTRALFLREARAAARVRHENVASVVYLSDEPDNFFMAIEFVDGIGLDAWLHTHGPMPPLLAMNLALQILRGLEAIHEQHLVHRDLKPSNLMLVPAVRGRTSAPDDPAGWQVKIIDFGLARTFIGDGLATQAGAVTHGFVGTAAYASPEQCAEQEKIDGRSDLYSFGCIIWEMLAGSPPFLATSQRAMLNQHIGRPPPLNRMMWLSPSIVLMLERLLAKNPEDRFANATETALALKQCRERLSSGEEQIDETKRPKPDDERPSWTTTSASAGPGLGSLFPLLALIAALCVAVGAWYYLREFLATRELLPSTAVVQSSTEHLSIGILPFVGIGDQDGSKVLASALQRDVAAGLARLPGMRVVEFDPARSAELDSLSLREIGRELGVSALLEASVRRDPSRTRISVHLVDPATGQSLWAETFDRELSTAGDVTDEISGGVMRGLQRARP